VVAITGRAHAVVAITGRAHAVVAITGRAHAMVAITGRAHHPCGRLLAQRHQLARWERHGCQSREFHVAVEGPVSARMDRDTYARPSDLRFDQYNPRLPESSTPSELEAIQALFEQADAAELVASIAHSGWLDYEPLIVLEEGSTVLEGNRRLAALRVLADPALQRSLSVVLPAVLHERAVPDTVRVEWVKTRNQARDFIGFKHVNGPHKWDSLAKARFAWEWLQEGGVTLEAVARRLGDAHNTVARLVNGYILYAQAKDLGFDDDQRTSARFAFSHLYTILARPNAREYLGLAGPVNDLLAKDPVERDRRDNLLQLMTWLYGQGEQRSVIKSQNPNLNQLTEVLGSRSATAILAATSDLKDAYAQVEDRSERFSTALFSLHKASRDAAAAVGDYVYDPDLQEMAEGVLRTAQRLVASMKAAIPAPEEVQENPDAR
jgi:hypothetical protein